MPRKENLKTQSVERAREREPSTANQSKPHDSFLKPPFATQKPVELSPATKPPVEETPALTLKPQISTISKEKAAVVEEPQPAGEVKVDPKPSLLSSDTLFAAAPAETKPAEVPQKTVEPAKVDEPKKKEEGESK